MCKITTGAAALCIPATRLDEIVDEKNFTKI